MDEKKIARLNSLQCRLFAYNHELGVYMHAYRVCEGEGEVASNRSTLGSSYTATFVV